MATCDDYIDDIVSSLKTTRQKRKEIAELFRDHLDLLTEEYQQEGMDAEQAERAAMERFGMRSSVRRLLNDELTYYRTLPNILAGLLIGAGILALYFLVGKKAAGTGFPIVLLSWVVAFLYLSPVGYFLPIVFRPMKKAGAVAGVTALCGVMLEAATVFFNLKAHTGFAYLSVTAPFILQLLFSGLISCIDGLLGFVLLQTVNRFTPSRM